MSNNARKGISSCELARDLGITQKSAWKLLNKIRLKMSELNSLESKLTGLVEVDEVYVGGKPRKNNCKWIDDPKRTSAKTGFFTQVERWGRVKVTEMDKPFTQKWVIDRLEENTDKEGSFYFSDEHKNYQTLDRHDFNISSVAHNTRYVAEDGVTHINNAESFHAIPKRMHFGTYHQMKHKDRYMQEAAFRWNHGGLEGMGKVIL